MTASVLASNNSATVVLGFAFFRTRSATHASLIVGSGPLWAKHMAAFARVSNKYVASTRGFTFACTRSVIHVPLTVVSGPLCDKHMTASEIASIPRDTIIVRFPCICSSVATHASPSVEAATRKNPPRLLSVLSPIAIKSK
jgi:hypothetical protein